MEEIENQLKELILDEDFTNLQNLASDEVNLMEILGVAHRELQHSNFLSWLFNPNESHNLGDFAVKEFIKLYYRENQFADLGLQTKLSVFDFVQLDFDDLEIRREYKNIDLILLSKKNEFCIVIENKIYSGEGKGQLKKYRELIEKEYPDFKHKIYIFLSLFEQNITEEEQDYYVQLDYIHIVKLIEQVIQRKGLKDKSRFVFEQYLQTLKSMLNQNKEIEEVAQKLYKKYKSAFDLVFQYAKTDGLIGNNQILELIRNETKITPYNSSKSYIRFHPNFLFEILPKMKEIGFVPNEFIFTDNYIFHFEFQIRRDFINFCIYVGEGNQVVRKNLYELFLRNSDVFSKVKQWKELTQKWHQSFKKEIVKKSEFDKFLEDGSFDLQNLIEKRFRELIDKDLVKIEQIFRTKLN